MKKIIAEIKQKIDIVEYLKNHGIQLKHTGRGTHKGLCPFHTEKTPSFVVNEDYQNFHCFGCGTKGDIISFVQHEHSLSFQESVKHLASEIGLQITEELKEINDLSILYRIVNEAYLYYNYEFKRLENQHPAKQEILKRNLDVNNEVYCYAPESSANLYQYLIAKGYSQEDILKTELCGINDNGKPWDFFRGRLLFVIKDFMGRPISFTSRKIYEDDNKGKYVNGRDSKLFHKENILFQSHFAKQDIRKEKVAIITEGQFDVLALNSIGVNNVVASSGTAFTSKQGGLLLRLVEEDGRLLFCFDGDDAGKKAAIKVFTNLPQLHNNAYVCFLPNKKDPCDFIQEGLGDELKELLDKSQPLYEWVLNTLIKSRKKMSESQRVKELVKCVGYVVDPVIINAMLKTISIVTATNITILKQNLTEYSQLANKEEIKEITFDNEIDEDDTEKRIEVDNRNNIDNCYVRIIALLTKTPHIFKNELKNIKFPKKFQPFLKELQKDLKEQKETGKWRFIKENYTDTHFADLLQKIEFIDEFETEEELLSYFISLIEIGNGLVIQERIKEMRANALSSLTNESNMKTIAEALELYEKTLKTN